MHLRDPGLGDDRERALERLVGLARKADDHVGRQVELVAQRLEPAEVRRGGVAARHVAEHAVVARLKRDVQVVADGRRLAKGCDEVGANVVDLDRREAEAREPRRRARVPNESRQVVAVLAVAVAAEVDPGQHHLAVSLLDALPDLREHGRR